MNWLLAPGRAVHEGTKYLPAPTIFWLALLAWLGVGNGLLPGSSSSWRSWWLNALVLLPVAAPVAHWAAALLVRALARASGNRRMNLSAAGRLAMLSYCYLAIPSLVLTLWSTFTTEQQLNYRHHVIPEFQSVHEALNNLALVHLPLPATFGAWGVFACGLLSWVVLCQAVVLDGQGVPGFSRARARFLFLGIPGGLLLLSVVGWVALRPVPLPRVGGMDMQETPVGWVYSLPDWPLRVEERRVTFDLGLGGAFLAIENVSGGTRTEALAHAKAAMAGTLPGLQWGETTEHPGVVGCLATARLDGEPMSAWITVEGEGGSQAKGTRVVSLLLPTRAWSVDRLRGLLRLMGGLRFNSFARFTTTTGGSSAK